MRIIVLAPLNGAVTGQSFVTTRLSRSKRWDVTCISNGGEGLPLYRKLTLPIIAFIKLCFYLVFCSRDERFKTILYFTCSRSFFGFYRELPLIFISKIMKVPVVNHLHGADLSAFFKSADPFTKKLIVFFYNLIDAHIVLLPAMKKEFDGILDEGRQKDIIHVIPNFSDDLPSNLTSSIALEKKDKIKILFLSNLIIEKGFLDLLEAFSLLPGSYKNKFELVIAGKVIANGHNATKINHEIENYENISGVKFVGAKHGEGKWKLLLESDILIFPTYYPTEAFPLVVLEAITAGCYVITTRHNYIPDLMKDICGLLIEPKNLASMQRALMHVADNFDEVELGKIRNAQVSKKYSFDSFIQRIDVVFNHIARRK
ncbi:glycosyltransferase family 4 protein [Aeromonas veronii]|uniref:glycosyltransferase family 4 protein n=1 Tax=Aeromonas veronii TaxID=654 RepID=UPI0029DD6C1F|nr:glycosyltransferase family 4 protein [Aeromonas veronii]MDX7878435.1 glycosyltransferase family 4 protein [Aeromonas veronii]